MPILLYFLLGVLVLAGAIVIYFPHSFGFQIDASDYDPDKFAAYFGGVAGPLLSFVALLAVAHALMLQQRALETERKRQLSDRHVRWLDELFRDMNTILDRPFPTNNGFTISLRDILDNEREPDSVSAFLVRERLVELVRVLSQYCEAVAIYRANISEFFDTKIFADRGARLLDGVKPFVGLLGGMSGPTLEFCDMHLRGDNRRAKSEAFERPTRQ